MWRTNFGRTAESGTNSSTGLVVPEPAANLILLLGVVFIAPRRGKLNIHSAACVRRKLFTTGQH
jgi:hypothetical protein